MPRRVAHESSTKPHDSLPRSGVADAEPGRGLAQRDAMRAPEQELPLGLGASCDDVGDEVASGTCPRPRASRSLGDAERVRGTGRVEHVIDVGRIWISAPLRSAARIEHMIAKCNDDEIGERSRRVACSEANDDVVQKLCDDRLALGAIDAEAAGLVQQRSSESACERVIRLRVTPPERDQKLGIGWFGGARAVRVLAARSIVVAQVRRVTHTGKDVGR